MRCVRWLGIVGVLAVFTVVAQVASAEAVRQPNIVFLMADDQCTNSLGCYGTKEAKTPHIDQLAKDGMVFDRHYDTTAICMASRANVMTGMFEYKTGCNFGTGPLLNKLWKQSYPQLLREAGYQTAFAGKFGFLVADKPGQRGRLPEDDFDIWGGGPGQTFYETRKNPSIAHYAKDFPHSTRAYGAFGRDFIESAAVKQQPFCLSISFKAPHHPVDPDPKFDDVYRNMTFLKPLNFGRKNGLHFSEQSRQGRQYERFHSWKYSTAYDDVMAKYYQQIHAIDVAVGMIRDALKAAGVADNTVIIYTSDNGFMCGAHGYGSKVLPYEESSRVPLIVYDPRHKNSGRQLRCGQLTGNVDIAPTIVALANLPILEKMDGRNLMALYHNPEVTIHESLPLINVWGPKPVYSLSVVTRDWKYIYWPWAEKGFEPAAELYNLRSDPLELKNLTSDSSAAKDLARMQQRYDDLIEDWQTKAVTWHGYRPLADVLKR